MLSLGCDLEEKWIKLMFGNVSSDLSYPCAHQASAHHHHLGQGRGGGQLSDEDASEHVDTSAASQHVDRGSLSPRLYSTLYPVMYTVLFTVYCTLNWSMFTVTPGTLSR